MAGCSLAEGPEEDDKTEAPTRKRKEDARRKGERLTSKELGTAMAGIAAALWISAFAGHISGSMKLAAIGTLSFAHDDIIAFQPIRSLGDILRPLFLPFAFLFVFMLAGAILGQAMTGGLGFTLESIRFKANKLNPISGLKRLFGMNGLIELGKSVLKTVVLVGLSALILTKAIPVLVALPRMPFDAAVSTVGALGRKLMLWLLLGLGLIAAVDIPAQIYQWLKKMRMSKKEVRDEMKEQEGSPEVKHALRRMAQQSLRQSSRQAIAEATVVLTNPTHFAIALRYDPEKDRAPLILARGRGMVAAAIRDVAREKGIPVLSYPSVARAIYFTGKVSQTIHPDLYMAVATILAFVMRVGAGAEVAPNAEAPESARFDEFGRRQPTKAR